MLLSKWIKYKVDVRKFNSKQTDKCVFIETVEGKLICVYINVGWSESSLIVVISTCDAAAQMRHMLSIFQHSTERFILLLYAKLDKCPIATGCVEVLSNCNNSQEYTTFACRGEILMKFGTDVVLSDLHLH